MGNDSARVLLKMVGREPVVAGANEVLIEEPGATSQGVQTLLLSGVKGESFLGIRAADPVSNFGGEKPNDEEGSSRDESGGINQVDDEDEDEDQKKAGQHFEEGGFGSHTAVKEAGGVGGGGPLQQMLAADGQAVEGDENGMEMEDGFVR